MPSTLATISLLPHASSPPPPEPLSRAHDALAGLFTYYSQTERGGQPAPPATDCPCFRCNDDTPCLNKTECTVCSVRDDAHCDTDSIACYTTAARACDCNDPPKPWPPGANTAATYLFVCGQIGGTGPAGTTVQPDQCVCESDWPFGCTNCYRWWSAVAIEAMASYAIAKELEPPPSQHAAAGAPPPSTEAETILHAIESAWTHAPYNAFWNATEHGTWVDDFAWYGLAYMRAHDWTGGVEWLRRAADIHDWARTYGWDRRAAAAGGECGGFWWNTNADKRFKDSISMVEVLHLAARLAVAPALAPAERRRFLASAEETWAWLFAFDGGRGLLAPNGIMSTGAQPEWCCAAGSVAAAGDDDDDDDDDGDGSRRCSNSRVPGMSYNHGLLMSSAALLYNATAEAAYLSRAEQLLAAAAANLTNADGAVRDVQRGSRMNAPGLGGCSGQAGHDPGTDFFSFKGVFVAHLAYFAAALGPHRLTRAMRAQLLSMVANSSTPRLGALGHAAALRHLRPLQRQRQRLGSTSSGGGGGGGAVGCARRLPGKRRLGRRAAQVPVVVERIERRARDATRPAPVVCQAGPALPVRGGAGAQPDELGRHLRRPLRRHARLRQMVVQQRLVLVGAEGARRRAQLLAVRDRQQLRPRRRPRVRHHDGIRRLHDRGEAPRQRRDGRDLRRPVRGPRRGGRRPREPGAARRLASAECGDGGGRVGA